MYSLFIQYYSFKNSVRIRGRGNSSNLSLSFTHFRISALQSSSKVPTVEMNRSILKEFYIIMSTQIITLRSLGYHAKAIRTPKINSYNQGGTRNFSYKGLCVGAPPEKGTFFRLQVYKRVGISLVEVM